MITWILGSIVIIWCILKRYIRNEKIEGYPLGMPRGSIRALIAIMVVAFPFSYLLEGSEIPSAILSAIFILVAFYFDSRKSIHEEYKELIMQIRDPVQFKVQKKKMKYPLYLPRYSVRTSLIIMLITIIIMNFYGPNVPFEIMNTFVDILLMISFFILGALFRRILNYRENKKTKKQITLKLSEEDSISDEKMIDYLSKLHPSWWNTKGKNCFSIITLIAIVSALFCYTINIDYEVGELIFYNITLRATLFLFINIYYGFRE